MVGIPRAFSIPSAQFPANIRSLPAPAIAAALNPHRMPRKAARGATAATAASKKAAPAAGKKAVPATTAAAKKAAPAAGKKAVPATTAAGKKAAPAAGKKGAAPAASKYWLLKTEPGEWSWSDQAGAPGGVGPWDGVRNHQAMNNLRAMRRGDRCLFYHSGAGAASRRVVGVVEVAREWYEGQEGEATAGGAVDVRAVGELRRPVSLEEIKKAAAAGEMEGMKDFALIRQARLSVMPVPVEVWDWICEMGGGFVQDGEVGEEEETEA
ncbi:hypothetical protein CFC21_053671 [Triticum aestivum]|uniref:EVE domain-containing protein n=2 Tax=Triticum aestivum TaxID=4565 RepID=A0A3B6HXH7_WHEAT|nr:thymocyte nuclear protein 1-like [Triticum aestivum]XP_044365226.1 thymocyte nuclear protein 1-like [Triticum aestivum]KAF7044450.1 hypothetical protein CFC21_053671 [Triticum aestivum]